MTLYRIINSDKNRLTNKLDGWEDAVQNVNEKYKGYIKELPDEAKRKRNLMISRDGAVRASNCGNKKKKREYLRRVLKYEPNLVNLMKYIFGVSKIHKTV